MTNEVATTEQADPRVIQAGGVPAGDTMAVSLPVFEGPLDLLLHLVREHRLDIFDIPIAFITDKYLAMIERMRELDLDVAGEFLVMASTLAYIKSRMLLPRPDPDDEADDSEEDGDPRTDLVRRLLEYQKYKEAAAALGHQDILGRDVFANDAPTSAPAPEGEPGYRQVSVFRLIEALDSVLARTKVKIAHEIVRERISLAQRLTEVVGVLRGRGRMTFRELFEQEHERQSIVVTFLVLLEMSRLGLASIFQEKGGGEIVITDTGGSAAADATVIKDDFR